MKWIIAGVGAGMIALYFALHRAGPVQKGAKNSGIGGAASKTGGVTAFPVGSIAQSFASIGSSIFGGSGTHSPVDPSIKAPGTMGGGTGGMIVAGSANDPTVSHVPDSQTIVTQLDSGSSTSGITVGLPNDAPTVSYDDYGG
jgi:hypothetical protein